MARDDGAANSAAPPGRKTMDVSRGIHSRSGRHLSARRLLPRCLSVLALIVAANGAPWAQEAWPSRPIKLMVPLTAGGGVDMMARLTAQHLSDQLGQQVVVENQGGAGGTIAANAVARARPDGYTLIFQSVSSAVVNALVYKNLPYDPVKDLIPVTLAGRFPLVLIANPEVPAKDLGELIALLKANPGKYSYGSSGVGTMPHLAGELFKSMAGVDIVHVPYRGNSAIMADLFAGRVAIMFDGPPTQLGNIQGGKVRAFAITTAERSPVLPTVPPVADTLPGYAIPFWTAIFAPAGTPKDVVERIAAETGKAMQHPDVLRRYGELGIVGVGSSPQELDRFWRAQLDYLGKIVKDANIKPVE
jgi:tripartite-type tricarboxylate transporter receptor subunit TctC